MDIVIKAAPLLFSLLIFSGCGLVLSKEEAARTTPNRNIGQGVIQGSFTLLDGTRTDLAADAGKIQVLMFVSETCAVCREETEILVQDRAARGIPNNAAFYSLVVGSIPEDARDWSRSLGVDWLVGLDPGDALFRNYCPGLQTPCTLLRNPIEGTLTALTGRHPIADWERLTGAWKY